MMACHKNTKIKTWLINTVWVTFQVFHSCLNLDLRHSFCPGGCSGGTDGYGTWWQSFNFTTLAECKWWIKSVEQLSQTVIHRKSCNQTTQSCGHDIKAGSDVKSTQRERGSRLLKIHAREVNLLPPPINFILLPQVEILLEFLIFITSLISKVIYCKSIYTIKTSIFG